MCSVFEKMSGITSTPALKDFAVTNGSLLNAESSAMEMLSAETVPENTEKLRFPTFTCRPSAAVNSDSSLGRKLFTFTRRGSTTPHHDQDANNDRADAKATNHDASFASQSSVGLPVDLSSETSSKNMHYVPRWTARSSAARASGPLPGERMTLSTSVTDTGIIFFTRSVSTKTAVPDQGFGASGSRRRPFLPAYGRSRMPPDRSRRILPHDTMWVALTRGLGAAWPSIGRHRPPLSPNVHSSSAPTRGRG